MKAILLSIHSDWNIQSPYVEWKEHPQHNMVMRGIEFPKGKGIIPIQQHPGRASVTVNIEFVIDGDPEDKEAALNSKILFLLKTLKYETL